MSLRHREIGNSQMFEQFADKITNNLFASLDKFKKADKIERVKILNDYLLEAGIPPEEINQINKFITLIDYLDDTSRTGWNKKSESNDLAGIKDRQVDNAEDVAMHSYGLINLCVLVAEGRSDINLARLVKMAAIHDLAESKTGDIVTAGKTNEEELTKSKAQLEADAIKEICASLKNDLATEVYAIWEESEAKQTPEAKLVKQLDKLEAVIQAYNYSLVDTNKVDPQEFIDTAIKKISDPKIIDILKHVQRLVTQSKKLIIIPNKNEILKYSAKVNKRIIPPNNKIVSPNNKIITPTDEEVSKYSGEFRETKLFFKEEIIKEIKQIAEEEGISSMDLYPELGKEKYGDKGELLYFSMRVTSERAREKNYGNIWYVFTAEGKKTTLAITKASSDIKAPDEVDMAEEVLVYSKSEGKWVKP